MSVIKLPAKAGRAAAECAGQRRFSTTFSLPLAKSGAGRSAPGPGGGREVLVELAFLALMLVGIARRIALLGNVRPFFRIGLVELEPLLEAVLGIRQDRL